MYMLKTYTNFISSCKKQIIFNNEAPHPCVEGLARAKTWEGVGWPDLQEDENIGLYGCAFARLEVEVTLKLNFDPEMMYFLVLASEHTYQPSCTFSKDLMQSRDSRSHT